MFYPEASEQQISRVLILLGQLERWSRSRLVRKAARYIYDDVIWRGSEWRIEIETFADRTLLEIKCTEEYEDREVSSWHILVPHLGEKEDWWDK